MVCAKCGCEQAGDAQFCRQCGARVTAAAPLPAWGPNTAAFYPAAVVAMPNVRVRQNLQPLGIMWCLFGAYRLVAMLTAAFFFHTMYAGGMFGGMPEVVSHMLRAAMPLIVTITVVMASAAILTGYGLLTHKPRARVLAIVFGILALLKIPFGTALGIYTLWVLAPATSAAEWEQIAPPTA